MVYIASYKDLIVTGFQRNDNQYYLFSNYVTPIQILRLTRLMDVCILSAGWTKLGCEHSIEMDIQEVNFQDWR